MTTLPNYPNLDQKTVPVNGPLDCMPTSLADGLEFLTGKKYSVYDIVTAGYGPNYVGFTSAAKFVDFCAKQGVKLYPIVGDNATLVKDIHEQIKLGHPCLLTEPDVYAPLHPDWSHVLSVFEEDPGTITAKDPYSVQNVTHPDAQWASLLQFREIWVMEKIQEDKIMPIDINSPEAKGFKELDPSHWQDTGNGHIIQFGLLADYKKRGYAFLGRPWSNEITIAPGHALQFYEFGVRQWVNGVVSSVALYDDGAGTDPRLVALRKQSQPAQAILDKIKADLAGA